MRQLDLDSRHNIEAFVDHFYRKIFADPHLAPIFVNVAEVDLEVHLPHIKDYWCKLLLGHERYRRHTMNIHRSLHAKRALGAIDFQRWINIFISTVDELFAGEGAERAKKVARAIATNMEAALQ